METYKVNIELEFDAKEDVSMVLSSISINSIYPYKARVKGIISNIQLPFTGVTAKLHELKDVEIMPTLENAIDYIDPIDVNVNEDISFDLMISQSDIYLYLAKKNGRNQVISGPLSPTQINKTSTSS